MEMDQKTLGIVATIAAVVLCGCPGLALLCTGALAAAGASMPDANVEDPQSALVGGLLMLCVAALMLVVPLLVGYFTLRARPKLARAEIIDYDEPLPPAI
jgi:UPF0716 family protein affecting phage T7 exclusion